jgi:hypothetical protein
MLAAQRAEPPRGGPSPGWLEPFGSGHGPGYGGTMAVQHAPHPGRYWSGSAGSRLNVTLPGIGNVSASGSVTRLDVSIDADGSAPFSGLTARNVDAVVSGAGTIFVTATQSLDAKVPGSGTILYSGNPPQVTTSIIGTGTVTPG